MVFADFHVHSRVSFDATDSMVDLCKRALEIGLREICFTDHHDIYSDDFSMDIPLYVRELAAAREAFPQLAIRSGLEAGDSPETRASMLRDIQRLQPDYVLLSTHAVNGIDPYYADDYYADWTREQGIIAYLEAVLDAIEHVREYDAVAHIGYAARYAPTGETPRPLSLADAPDLLEEILKTLIRMDKALEVNTSKQAPIPGLDIVQRYRELGGEWIVLGSDAHAVSGLAHRFQETAETLRSMGFRWYCTYAERERRPMPL